MTFTVPQAAEVIAELVNDYQEDQEVIIGAGTVLDAVTARLAIMAGAEYIVSPTFDRDTAEICNLYQVPYLPGCMTITEMKEALKSGADIIKLFPGSAYGPSIISFQSTIAPTEYYAYWRSQLGKICLSGSMPEWSLLVSVVIC